MGRLSPEKKHVKNSNADVTGHVFVRTRSAIRKAALFGSLGTAALLPACGGGTQSGSSMQDPTLVAQGK